MASFNAEITAKEVPSATDSEDELIPEVEAKEEKACVDATQEAEEDSLEAEAVKCYCARILVKRCQSTEAKEEKTVVEAKEGEAKAEAKEVELSADAKEVLTAAEDQITGDEENQQSEDSGFGSFTFEVGPVGSSSDEDIVAFDADNLPSCETEDLGDDDPFYMRGEDFARTPSPGKSVRRTPLGSPRVVEIVQKGEQLKEEVVEKGMQLRDDVVEKVVKLTDGAVGKIEQAGDFFTVKSKEFDQAAEAKTQEVEAFVSMAKTEAKDCLDRSKVIIADAITGSVEETEKAIRRDYEPLAYMVKNGTQSLVQHIESSMQEIPDKVEELARSSSDKFDREVRDTIESSPRMKQACETLQVGAQTLEKKVDEAVSALAASPKVKKGLAKVVDLAETSRDLASEFAETTRSKASMGYNTAKQKAFTAATRVIRNHGGA